MRSYLIVCKDLTHLYRASYYFDRFYYRVEKKFNLYTIVSVTDDFKCDIVLADDLKEVRGLRANGVITFGSGLVYSSIRDCVINYYADSNNKIRHIPPIIMECVGTNEDEEMKNAIRYIECYIERL